MAETRTKKSQVAGPTDEIEIRVPPSQSERRISVLARKLQNEHVKVVIAADKDIMISDAQPVSLDTISVVGR